MFEQLALLSGTELIVDLILAILVIIIILAIIGA